MLFKKLQFVDQIALFKNCIISDLQHKSVVVLMVEVWYCSWSFAKKTNSWTTFKIVSITRPPINPNIVIFKGIKMKCSSNQQITYVRKLSHSL